MSIFAMKDIDIIDDIKTFLQKQPYNLTIARHQLGIHQLRVMVRIIEQLQPMMAKVNYEGLLKQSEDIWVKINVSELVVGGNYKPLREALDGMMKKIVRMYHSVDNMDGTCDTTELGMPMLQRYKYKHGESEVQIQLPRPILGQIVDLARGYTRYSLDIAFNTSSPNVFKLYQYFAHFRDKKQTQCNVDTLRDLLQIKDKYAMPNEIKRGILVPAMNELKEKADVWFDIAERVTKGRKMMGWKFNIYTKDEPKKVVQKSLSEPQTDLEKRLTTQFALSLKQARNVLQKIPLKEMHKELYQINLAIIDGKVRNKGGYTAKRLSEKFDVKL